MLPKQTPHTILFYFPEHLIPLLTQTISKPPASTLPAVKFPSSLHCLLPALSPWSAHRTLLPIKPVPNSLPLSMLGVLSTSHFLFHSLLTSQCGIWVSRCLLKTGWRKRGGSWITCDLRDSATAAGELATLPGGLQCPPEPEATLDSYSCSHCQVQLSLLKSPCLFKKKFSMILQESVSCTSLHDKHFFKQALFFSLCIWKQHTLSQSISYTLGMKWETSLWLKAPAQGSSARRKPQASSQALHMTKH